MKLQAVFCALVLGLSGCGATQVIPAQIDNTGSKVFSVGTSGDSTVHQYLQCIKIEKALLANKQIVARRMVETKEVETTMALAGVESSGTHIQNADLSHGRADESNKVVARTERYDVSSDLNPIDYRIDVSGDKNADAAYTIINSKTKEVLGGGRFYSTSSAAVVDKEIKRSLSRAGLTQTDRTEAVGVLPSLFQPESDVMVINRKINQADRFTVFPVYESEEQTTYAKLVEQSLIENGFRVQERPIDIKKRVEVTSRAQNTSASATKEDRRSTVALSGDLTTTEKYYQPPKADTEFLIETLCVYSANPQCMLRIMNRADEVIGLVGTSRHPESINSKIAKSFNLIR